MNTRIAVVVLVMLMAVLPLQAQDDECPSLVETALTATDSVCDATGRNQVCYGNISVLATAREGVDDFVFEQQGDIVDVVAVDKLALSSMNTDTEEWGVILMRLQANLPDTAPGQNVTLLLFGDVEIENAVDIPEDEEDTDADNLLNPMQAFVFKSGISDAPCDDAPDSGILIQTPEGSGKIELQANGVDITLASSIYVQAEVADDMVIHVVEGFAVIEAQGVSRTVPAGAQVSIPLDDDLQPVGEPGDPEPYEMANLSALPVGYLEREIAIAPPATPDMIQQVGTHLGNIMLDTWSTNYGVMTFGADGRATYESDGGRILFTLSGNTMTGYWVENSSSSRCEFERDGSLYWGRIIYVFDEQFSSFAGGWGYCEAEPTESWNGTRQSGS